MRRDFSEFASRQARGRNLPRHDSRARDRTDSREAGHLALNAADLYEVIYREVLH